MTTGPSIDAKNASPLVVSNLLTKITISSPIFLSFLLRLSVKNQVCRLCKKEKVALVTTLYPENNNIQKENYFSIDCSLKGVFMSRK